MSKNTQRKLIAHKILDIELNLVTFSSMDRRRLTDLYGEVEYTRYISDLCLPHHIIYDVGAAIGTFSLLLNKKAHQVIAFEPDPTHFAVLSENISLNHGTNITAYQTALGKETGQLVLFTDKDTGGTCPSFIPTNHKSRIYAEVISGDSFVENHPVPDILKIDVEGFEIEVLEGFKNTLKSGQIKYVFIEIHHGLIKRAGKDEKIIEEYLKNYKNIYTCNRVAETLKGWMLK
jgi:FkbM family methyltransferase